MLADERTTDADLLDSYSHAVIRAVGEYLKERGATVSAFYVSNVEEYLRQDGTWPRFCANVAALPRADGSSFIRAVRNTEPGFPVEGFVMRLDPIANEVRQCAGGRGDG